MRICSFLPAATEILFGLGLGDEIVGVTHECDFPSDAKTKPVIVRSRIAANGATSLGIDRQVRAVLAGGKGLYTIDAEALEKAAPDAILTQALCAVCALAYDDVVKAACALPHMPEILSLNPRSLADVMDDIGRIGKATRREAEARALLSGLRGRINAVSRQSANANSRPRVVCLEWLDPLYAAGHWVPEMVALAGGRDVVGRVQEPSAQFCWRQLLELKPEIIILMACGFDLRRTKAEGALLSALTGWNKLPAVRNGNVFAVDGSAYFSRPGPRLVDGLEFLAQIIHPELFSWQAPAAAVQRIYS